MSQINLQTYIQHIPRSSFILVFALFSGNLFFNIIANSSFKASAASSTWQNFLAWQILGNLAGLITVLTLTGLLHYFPLHVVFPLTTGMAVIGVQVVAARLLFNETITSPQWLGTILIVIGIVMIGSR